MAALFAVEKLVGNRVSTESEIEGLDVGEMGLAGYHTDDAVAASEETAVAPAAPGALAQGAQA
jgi:hypothetical protein